MIAHMSLSIAAMSTDFIARQTCVGLLTSDLSRCINKMYKHHSQQAEHRDVSYGALNSPFLFVLALTLIDIMKIVLFS